MRRPNSIAFPVAIVLILGMALMMVISTVLTVAVFLLTDGQSRKKSQSKVSSNSSRMV